MLDRPSLFLSMPNMGNSAIGAVGGAVGGLSSISSSAGRTNARPGNDASISEHDVLLGRGGETNSHVGNRAYRRIVFENQGEYLMAKKKEKTIIAKRIVSLVKSNGGRFLKKDDNQVWVDAGDAKAVSKTSQALREGLDVRNHRVREKKLFREDRSRPVRVVTGKVAGGGSGGGASGNEHDSQSLPDLRDEANARGASFPRYKPSVDKSAVKDAHVAAV
jgi:hypothetical protein